MTKYKLEQCLSTFFTCTLIMYFTVLLELINKNKSTATFVLLVIIVSWLSNHVSLLYILFFVRLTSKSSVISSCVFNSRTYTVISLGLPPVSNWTLSCEPTKSTDVLNLNSSYLCLALSKLHRFNRLFSLKTEYNIIKSCEKLRNFSDTNSFDTLYMTFSFMYPKFEDSLPFVFTMLKV